jgi:hypothetical protein
MICLGPNRVDFKLLSQGVVLHEDWKMYKKKMDVEGRQ